MIEPTRVVSMMLFALALYSARDQYRVATIYT